MFFSIVIPVHNEIDSLKVLIPSLVKAIEAIKGHSFEVLVIDDCSTDDTAKLLNEFAARHSYVRPILLAQRSGQTGAFREAFIQARGEVIIRMDGDLQDHPDDLIHFVNYFADGADLVMGLRECRKHKKILRLASSIYDMLVLVLFDSPLHSNSGSFVGFKAEFVRGVPLKPNDHRYLPLIVMARGARNIREVFVRHGQRNFGRSKYHPLRKVILGLGEVFAFFIRLKVGYYQDVR